MRFLRSNTAVIITVGPFYDKTDGVSIETALTITNERITLTADTDAGSAPTNILDNITGATSGTSNDLNYITGNDAGMMQLELAAADTNRLGRMMLSITDAANHVPVFHEFMVLNTALYDALFASSGGAIPNAVAGASTGLLISGSNAGTTTLGALTVTGATTLTGNVAAAAGVTITQSSSNTAGVSITGNGTGSGILATGGTTGHGISAVGGGTSGNGIRATGTAGNSAAVNAIGQGSAAGVLATGGATGAGMSLVGGATSGFGLAIDYTAPLGPIKELGILESGTLQSATSTTAVLRSATSFVDDLIIGSTIAITGGTGVGQSRLITDWANSSDTALVETWTTTPDNTSTYEIYRTAPSTGGGSGLDAAGVRAAVGLASANLDTQLGAIDDLLDSEIPALTTAVADLPTNAELATALGTADDAVLSAIAALNNLSQANIRTAVGLGSANLDTQLAAIDDLLDTEMPALTTAVADLPTNAELATALGTADDAVLAQIALVKAKTDSLTFTVANVLDANVQRINDVTIVGDGSGTPFQV